METDQIRVNSEKLDVDGEPLIQFIILGDGTILPLKLGSDVTEEELEARQAALAWVICYIFIGFFGLTLAGFYAFFRAQNQAKNENFLDFLARQLQDPASFMNDKEKAKVATQTVEL